MTSTTITFIGVGSMGTPMAARLVQAGFNVCVVDADAKKATEFAAQYGTRCATLENASSQPASIVVTMLPTSDIVEQVLFESGFLKHSSRDTLIVEMSSGVPAKTVQLAKRAADLGHRLIDAPVSGGVKGAETGALAIMAGGDESDITQAEPILLAIGSSVTRTGAVGSAHAMKALNNLVSATGFLVGVEALLIGKKFGLDPNLMVDVLNASSGVNFSTQRKFKQFVLSGKFDAGFGLDLMLKDIANALDLAHQTKCAVPMASACHQFWEGARNVLGPGQDHTAAARVSGMLAGSEL